MVTALERAIAEIAALPDADQEEIGRQLLSHVEKLRALEALDEGIVAIYSCIAKTCMERRFSTVVSRSDQIRIQPIEQGAVVGRHPLAREDRMARKSAHQALWRAVINRCIDRSGRLARRRFEALRHEIEHGCNLFARDVELFDDFVDA